MPNHLADATSPYLLQHKDNPVDWWPWCDEAFAEAKRRDVPVLLSVGYAACHWCHVMAHESFEDEAVADVVNPLVVAIKVDREERPDVDAVHMEVTQAMTGSGGWPMTVFLTPDRQPFYAGTYYPPRPSHGRPSFVESRHGDPRGVDGAPGGHPRVGRAGRRNPAGACCQRRADRRHPYRRTDLACGVEGAAARRGHPARRVRSCAQVPAVDGARGAGAARRPDGLHGAGPRRRA